MQSLVPAAHRRTRSRRRNCAWPLGNDESERRQDLFDSPHLRRAVGQNPGTMTEVFSFCRPEGSQKSGQNLTTSLTTDNKTSEKILLLVFLNQ